MEKGWLTTREEIDKTKREKDDAAIEATYQPPLLSYMLQDWRSAIPKKRPLGAIQHTKCPVLVHDHDLPFV